MNANDVERRGIELAMQLITRSVSPGSPVIDTNDARNRVFLQRAIGDYLILHEPTRQWHSLDVKTEAKYTGNLFVESWSNKTANRHARDGWIFTLGSDWLVMVYLDVRSVFIVDLPKLKNWCVVEGRMLDYREATVHRYQDGEQKNRTTGHLVPWAVLVETIGFKCYQQQDGEWVKCILPDTRRRESA